jgi:methionine-rich copper-binding protein CopC
VTPPGQVAAAVAVCAVALLLPAAASAHAYLIKTFPAASVTFNTPPPEVALTFDEAVEPRFAIISVTDPQARQETTGLAQRSPGNPDTLIVPLKRVSGGWYLVYWRAILVDGHPVQGAFTFAIGPNPGPAPQFKIYTRAAPALVMVGHSGLNYAITPTDGKPFSAFIVDHAAG